MKNFFGTKTNGCFVEVGAYDGESASNTSGLADIGWKGYYIEPVPSSVERCKARHAKNPNIIVSQKAIGSAEGVITLMVGEDVTTASPLHRKILENAWLIEKNGKKSKKVYEEFAPIQIHQETLENYLSINQVPIAFDLLVIDVEGLEWEVLRNWEIEKWKPKVIIIELHDMHPDFQDSEMQETFKAIITYFETANYRVAWKDTRNTIYVRNGL